MSAYRFAWRALKIVALLVMTACDSADSSPPSFKVLPQFELIDQDGNVFTSEDMSGKTWITSFIFTSCPTSCPLITARQANLQKSLQSHAGIHFLSISVDPETDQPQKLRDYARQYGADQKQWRLLTGPRETIKELALKGFLVAVGARERVDNGYDIVHSRKLFLVDETRTLRGFYDTDEQGLSQLMHDAIRLSRGR
ncbi:MAG: SCO family protein [Myxococcota bacterium]